MTKIKNQDESPLCNDRTLRDKCVNHYEVLEKVKQLLLLPGTDMMSIDQVADYYEVTPEYIKILYSNNKGEIDLDGVEMLPRSYYDGSKLNITSVVKKQTSVTYTFEDGQIITINNRGLKAFSRRAVLRIRMLLQQSDVAKEVRTQLLNIEEKLHPKPKLLILQKNRNLC